MNKVLTYTILVTLCFTLATAKVSEEGLPTYPSGQVHLAEICKLDLQRIVTLDSEKLYCYKDERYEDIKAFRDDLAQAGYDTPDIWRKEGQIVIAVRRG